MVLADRLSKLLQEKDQRKTNKGSGWLETEALSGTMQETGTFKKALWRRFQSFVAPILSEVIAYVDRDGNLELADSEDNWVVQLWLKTLQDSSLTELRFADFILEEGGASVVRSKVPVLKSGYRSHSFLCKFPFSWLLKERMDELCKDARNIAGEININFSLFPSNLVFEGDMVQGFETGKCFRNIRNPHCSSRVTFLQFKVYVFDVESNQTIMSSFSRLFSSVLTFVVTCMMIK